MYKQMVIISGQILDPAEPIYTFPQRDTLSINLGFIIVVTALLAIFTLTIIGFFVEHR